MFNINNESDSQWLPVSDLMSGLMVVFLFFSLLFFQLDTAEEKAVSVKKTQKADLGQKLEGFLQPNLENWNAAYIDSTFTIQFYTGESVLFEQGKSTLSTNFKNILANFFPAYMYTLHEAQALNWIQELRIEGHSSSDGSYFHNMELSQQRANAVLQFIWGLIDFSYKEQAWLEEKVASIGMGTKQLIYEHGKENEQKSRRVTFSLVFKSDAYQKIRINDTLFCPKPILVDKQLRPGRIFSFPLRNSLKQALQIKGIITSKDCTVLNWTKQPIEVAKTTSIRIAYTPCHPFKAPFIKLTTNYSDQPFEFDLSKYVKTK